MKWLLELGIWIPIMMMGWESLMGSHIDPYSPSSEYLPTTHFIGLWIDNWFFYFPNSGLVMSHPSLCVNVDLLYDHVWLGISVCFCAQVCGFSPLLQCISSWLTEHRDKEGLTSIPLHPSVSSPSSQCMRPPPPHLCQAWFTVQQSAPAGRPLQDVTS